MPGIVNHEADFESRNPSERTEWSIQQAIFNRIVDCLGTVELDLFASRHNAKLTNFCSWRSEPGAMFVDAFTLDWSKCSFYAFPPFSLITRCLQKVQVEQAEGLMIVPLWPTQAWFSRIMQMLTDYPQVFGIILKLIKR